MTVASEIKNGVQVVHINQSQLVDEQVIGSISNQIKKLVEENDTGSLLLNLSNVSFVSSLMVGQFMTLKKACGLKRIDFKICNINDAIMKVLQVVQMDKLIRLYDTEEEALAAFDYGEHDTVVNMIDGRAVDVLIQRSVMGEADAQWELAKCYEEGNGVEANPEEAMKWYEASALQDHTESQHKLGMLYAYGINVEQDFQRSLPWYRLAAEKGHADSQYMLALAFDHDLAGVCDKNLARKWYSKAASQGHEKAIDALEQLKSG